ncbi:MAG: amino acid ABC transporter ATP-binding protein [Planctomycetes bacterium]|nr:amino acid ABC transporter ATP-binding protein [Planctomycetota bacterium]
MSWPIVIRNITKRFGDRTILDNISLTIPPGETLALLGPSGGGKSTLLRCLNGLAPFDAGEIQIGPHRLAPDAQTRAGELQEVRRSFGMIFQDFQLFPHLSVRDNIVEAPTRVLGLSSSEAQERATRLLERVGMAEHAHAFPQQLSGGQKQRVAIARALAMEPVGLLCDEITSALDPELKNEVLGVLEDLKLDGLTLILVTHEIGFARRAADRVVMLCDGRILEEGTPADVLDHPKTERMALFLRRVLG